MGNGGIFDSNGDTMKIKLYAWLAFVAIGSAIFSLIRIAIGHDAVEAVQPNIVIGSICVVGMYLLSRKEGKQIARRN